MMKVARDDVVDVIAVTNGLVAAVRAVPVPGFVLGAVVVRRAVVRVGVRDRDLARRGFALHVFLLSTGSSSGYSSPRRQQF
jgi:hypothetical protein